MKHSLSRLLGMYCVSQVVFELRNLPAFAGIKGMYLLCFFSDRVPAVVSSDIPGSRRISISDPNG